MKALENEVTYILLYVPLTMPAILFPDLDFRTACWLCAATLPPLLALTWARGALIGRRWLFVFPLMGTAGALLPVVNTSLLVPMGLHFLGIIRGVKATPRAADAGNLSQ